MGRTGGGLFNTTMKSGANDWHGEGHVQQRPSALAARDFFASARPDWQLLALRRIRRRTDSEGQDVLLGIDRGLSDRYAKFFANDRPDEGNENR